MGNAGVMRLHVLLILAGMLAGCAAVPMPVVMDSHVQRRIITPCDDDQFCFRRSYEVLWDTRCVQQVEEEGAVVCSKGSRNVQVQAGFPVSYRSLEQIVETGDEGYQVALPAAGAVKSRR